MRNTIRIFAAGLMLATTAQVPAHAFGADGHREIGSLADRMLAKHPNARNQVRELLGTLKLAQVAPWADCLRSVKRQANGSFRFIDTKNPTTGRDPFPECDIFETASGRDAMEDFVSRNWSTCFPNATECHTKYHFINLAIQRDRYVDGLAGTTKFDIAHALAAAIATL